MKIAKYDEKTTSFLAHRTRQQINEESFSGTKTANYSAGGAATGASERFFGAVAVPGGVVLVPYSAGVVGLLGHNGAYSAGPVIAGSARFRGGCLTDNDLVVFAPSLHGFIGIYDLKTGLYRNGAAVPNGTGSGPGFAGCCKLKSGKILLAPRTRNTIGLYDPFTDTFTEGPAHGLATNTFSGCVPLPDGRALLIPYDGDFFMIYDPEDNTLVKGPVMNGTAQFGSAVVLSNGDVVCAPYSKNGVAIYRFASNTVYLKIDPIIAAASKFMGSALTFDGRVVFTPWDHPNVMYYDPSDDTLTTTTAVAGSSKFAGAAQLPSGQIAFAPYSNADIGLVDVNTGFASSDALRANMYFNSTI